MSVLNCHNWVFSLLASWDQPRQFYWRFWVGNLASIWGTRYSALLLWRSFVDVARPALLYICGNVILWETKERSAVVQLRGTFLCWPSRRHMFVGSVHSLRSYRRSLVYFRGQYQRLAPLWNQSFPPSHPETLAVVWGFKHNIWFAH